MGNPDIDRLQTLVVVAVVVRNGVRVSVERIGLGFVETHHPVGIGAYDLIGSSRKVEALYAVVVVIAKLRRCRGCYYRGFIYRDRKAVLAKAVRGSPRLGID